MEELGIDTNGMTKSQTRNAVKDAVAAQNPTQENAAAEGKVSAPVQQEASQTASEGEVSRRMEQAQRAAAAFGENGSRAFEAAYDADTASTLSPEDAYAGFAKVYNAALKGETVESDLPAHMKLAAEYAGQNDAIRAEQAAYFGEESGVVRDDNFKKAHLSSRTVRVLDAIAKVAGVQVRFVDKVDGGNARYRNGVIEISVKTKNPVRAAFSHEIVHRIRETAPAQYQALARFVQTHINSKIMSALNLAYGKTYNTTNTAEVTEEIVAEAVGLMMGDRTVMEQFVQDDRNAAEKLRDVIRDLVNAVKRALSGQNVKLNETQVAAFYELLSDLEGFEAALTDALNAIPQNEQKNTTQEGGEWKYSRAADVLALEGVDWMDNFSSIKDQLEVHAVEISKTDTVASVEYVPSPKSKHLKLIMDQIPLIGGGKIKRGKVEFMFDEGGADTILEHAKRAEEQAAALAAPYVAKYGKLIAGHKNHEGRGFPTLTYAAPVEINGTTVNVGVVVQFSKNGRPHAVNVGLQDGGVFKLNKKEVSKGTDSRVNRYGQGTALPTMDTPKATVSHSHQESNPQNPDASASTNFTEKQSRNLTPEAERLLREAVGEAQLAGMMNQGRKDAKKLREANARTDKAREQRDQKIRELKAQQKERMAKRREQLTAKEYREKIERHVKALSQKLLKPTDTRHVPEELRKAVAKLLDAINLESSYTLDPDTVHEVIRKDGKFGGITGKHLEDGSGLPTKRTKAALELKAAYQKVIKDEASDMVIDPSMEPLFAEVADMADIRLADMNSEQAKKVWDLIRMVERSITTAGQNLTNAKTATTAEWANRFVQDTSSRKSRKGRVIENLRLDMENPYTFFSHFGEAGMDVYRMLRDAQDHQQDMESELESVVRKLVTPKEVRQLENEVHEYRTERGDLLVLTTAHLMEIYELMKRQQAQEHLVKGGIVQPEIKVKGHKTARGNDAVLLTAEDLMHMIEPLTDEQMAVADALQALTTGMLADWGNEASMQAYGYKKFTGEDYWPIHAAGEGVHSNVEKNETNTRSIKNIGLAKNTIPHANNPLDIGGLFNTFAAHAADMTDYAAWLCPMEDANRLFNYEFRDAHKQRTGKSIKGLLDRVGGKGAQAYWKRLMEDIQNGINASNDTAVMRFIDRMYGNTKGASVGANLRVIIQQPTAIIRAAAVMNPADIAAGLVHRGGWKAALEHSPIAKRKDMGGFDISSPMQMGEMLYDSKGKLRKFNDAMMWAAGKADALTWGWMWKACERAVKGANPDLSGEAFYDAVNKMFTDVIDQSQVVDGVLQRSQMMRSGNAIVKQATAFMGEPTMTANMLIRAVDQLAQESDKSKRGKAWKQLGRTVGVLVLTNVVNALAQSLVDAWRDDDEDKDYWERFWSAFTGIDGDEETAWSKAWKLILKGNAGSSINPGNYVPFVKDVFSMIQGYNVVRADADAIGDVIKAVQATLDSFSGDGSKTVVCALKELANQAGKVLGISAGNILRDAWGIVRSIAVATDNVAVQYEMEKAIYKIGSESNSGRFVDILFRAYQSEPEMYEHIYSDMVQSGIPEDAIRKGMEARLKKAQGVTSVDDLKERYLPPALRTEYDTAMGGIQSSYLWVSATEEQRDRAADRLYNMVCGTTEGNKLSDVVDGGKDVGLDDGEYVLYRLALDMHDKPTEKGNLGSYTSAEIAEALMAMDGLSDKEKAYLWTTQTGNDKINSVLTAGVSADEYMEFMVAFGGMTADKDRNGNTVSGSKKEKVVDYLERMDLSDREFRALMEAVGYKVD